MTMQPVPLANDGGHYEWDKGKRLREELQRESTSPQSQHRQQPEILRGSTWHVTARTVEHEEVLPFTTREAETQDLLVSLLFALQTKPSLREHGEIITQMIEAGPANDHEPRLLTPQDDIELPDVQPGPRSILRRPSLGPNSPTHTRSVSFSLKRPKSPPPAEQDHPDPRRPQILPRPSHEPPSPIAPPRAVSSIQEPEVQTVRQKPASAARLAALPRLSYLAASPLDPRRRSPPLDPRRRAIAMQAPTPASVSASRATNKPVDLGPPFPTISGSATKTAGQKRALPTLQTALTSPSQPATSPNNITLPRMQTGGQEHATPKPQTALCSTLQTATSPADPRPMTVKAQLPKSKSSEQKRAVSTALSNLLPPALPATSTNDVRRASMNVNNPEKQTIGQDRAVSTTQSAFLQPPQPARSMNDVDRSYMNIDEPQKQTAEQKQASYKMKGDTVARNNLQSTTTPKSLAVPRESIEPVKESRASANTQAPGPQIAGRKRAHSPDHYEDRRKPICVQCWQTGSLCDLQRQCGPCARLGVRCVRKNCAHHRSCKYNLCRYLHPEQYEPGMYVQDGGLPAKNGRTRPYMYEDRRPREPWQPWEPWRPEARGGWYGYQPY